jgi:hypothetical protein
MADSTKPLETDQQPPEEGHSAALENSSGEQYQGTAIIKRVPDEVHTTNGERHTKEAAYWDKQVYWQRIMAWATIFAFGAAAIYACIAHEQNRLTRMILKGTQAADVEFNYSIFSPFRYAQQMEVQFVNRGKISAMDFQGKIEVTRQTLPDRKVIRSDFYDLGGKGTYVSPSTANDFPLELRDFSDEDVDLCRTGKEMITIRGRYAYDDGLGDRVERTFCAEFLSYDGGRSGPNWQPCQIKSQNNK